MSVKSVVSYACIFFSIIIIIFSLATNYWYEFEIPELKEEGFLTVKYYRVGLFEQCSEIHYRWGWENKTVDDQGCYDYDEPKSIDDWEARRDSLVAMFIIALTLTLISFVFITVYCVTGKYYFPIGRTAICFVSSALVLIIGLMIYTYTFINHNVAFSWSYGAGWSAAVMYIISTILIYADK